MRVKQHPHTKLTIKIMSSDPTDAKVTSYCFLWMSREWRSTLQH